MIVLTRKTKEAKEIVVNAELIESIEDVPDTIVTLVNGKRIMVKESIEEIIKRVIEYKKNINFMN